MAIITGEKLQETADISILNEDIYRFHTGLQSLSCELCVFGGDARRLIVKDNNQLEKIKRAGIIFVYTHLLKSFFEKIYPHLDSSFILMSHNSDDKIDAQFEKYLNEGKIFRWFAQNVAIKNERLISLPIGIANSQWPHGNTNTFEEIVTLNRKKEKLLYMNFDVRTNFGGRLPVYDLFKNAPYVTVSGHVAFRTYLEDLSRHFFCISPPGNGLDCHRIWECLYLGVIPIVLNNPNMDYYKDLPILFLDDWKKINPSFLKDKLEEIKNEKFNVEKLDNEYWKQLIRSEKMKMQLNGADDTSASDVMTSAEKCKGIGPVSDPSAGLSYVKNRDASSGKTRHLVIEGWRFISHSYAIVNQFQCLEMLKQKDLIFYHRDLPFFNPNWTPVKGLFNEDAEFKLRAIPNPPENLNGDVLFRIGYPYDFRASSSAKTFVFGTSELGVIYDKMLLGNIPLRKALKDSDVRIIVPSNWSKQGFVRSGAEPERITVIPHGVDTNIFKSLDESGRAGLREKRGWQESFVFLNIGAMTGNKGIVILLKSFAEVATYYSNAKLVLKGMDSLYTSKKFLTDIKKQLSDSELDIIAPRMEYIGGTSSFADIAGLYQAADCYVSPYLAEGFNMPVLEAAACGLPVICTEGGSTDDFVTEEFALRIRSDLKEHRENGCISRVLLIPDGGHLITLMRKAIKDSAWRTKACLSGPVFVKKKFTWEDVTRQLLDAFFKPDQGLAYGRQKWVSVRPEKLESEGDTMDIYDRRKSQEQGGSGKSPDELYEEAQKLINSGSKKEAIGALEMFLAMHPNYALAHNDLGVLCYNQGNKDEALHHYEKAAQLEPYNDTFQKNLADFYYVEAGRVEEALQIYVKLLEANPTDLEILLNLGKICETLKMINDAKVFYDKVLELEPWNIDARERLDELGRGIDDSLIG